MRYLIIRLFYRTPITSDRRNESVNISGEIPRPRNKDLRRYLIKITFAEKIR